MDNRQRTRVPHPLPYQGSKRNLAPTIVGYFPIAPARLIEPFAGSAAVTLAALQQNRVAVALLNDANAPLMRLWTAIVQAPERLADEYERLWLAQRADPRHFYTLIRDEFNRTQQPVALLYLLARCVKAAVRYNAGGAFNQSADHRRLGARPATMRRQIMAASALLQDRVQLSSTDYRDVLARARPGDLVYLDPPYQGVCGQRDPRYLDRFDSAAFSAALDDLNRRRIAYLVSYDGRTGARSFGYALPAALDLRRIELDAGRSAQATLLGRSARTYESLYLSPALLGWLATGTYADHLAAPVAAAERRTQGARIGSTHRG